MKILYGLLIIFSHYVFALELDIINLVWGRDYTDAFMKVSLPLQLCPGNLGIFPPGSARYRLYTTRDDWEYMQSFPSMQKLQEMIPVDFIEIPMPNTDSNRYAIMNYWHNQAIEDAWKSNRALIFLSPDCMISNQTFQTILMNAEQGKKVILTSGIRTTKENIVPIIEAALANDPFYHGLDPRHLVCLCLPEMHEMNRVYFCEQTISSVPYALYWQLDDQNILSCAFHLHPIFVWPERQVLSSSTIDFDFYARACPFIETWKIITDSDEMAVFEFTTSQARTSWSKTPCNPLTVALWAQKSGFVAHHHLLLFSNLTLIHSCEYKSEWEEIESKADSFIKDCLFRRRLLE